MYTTVPRTIAALLLRASVFMPGAAFAQAAEGAYPGIISCDFGQDGRPAIRRPVTVEISGGRVRYAVSGEGGQESGSGRMTGRQIVLTGRGVGYEARYTGEVGGRGGLLTGTRTGSGSRHDCQILLGDGRG